MSHNDEILLQGGTVLQHRHGDEVVALHDIDLLIKGDTIHRIDKNIRVESGTRCINCRDKIISPGFVDTHHHVWQTQLKGRHSDDTLLDYHPKGNLQYYNYTPEDIFWGELGGLMEAIDGGTTCIVDHAHLTKSPDHVYAGISATIASRIRSTFCYSLVANIKRWDDEFELGSPPIPDWFFPTFEHINDVLKSDQGSSFTGGKFSIGFGFDNYHLPRKDVENLFVTARKHGARVITSHWRRNNIAADDNFSIPKILRDYNLLGPDVLLSHSTGSTEEEFKLLRDADAYSMATSATESQMAHGDIIGFKEGVLASMGTIVSHSNNPGSMLHAMQIGLAVARSHRNSDIIAQGKFPKYIEPKTLQAFNLATIYGARAINMEKNLGSLEEGKCADITIFSTSSPAMSCVADEDPLVAVVRHATPADVETVIIGGEVRKENGALVDVTYSDLLDWKGSDNINLETTEGKLSWSRVAQELKRSRLEIQQRIDKCNIDAAKKAVIKMWGMPDAEKVLA